MVYQIKTILVYCSNMHNFKCMHYDGMPDRMPCASLKLRVTVYIRKYLRVQEAAMKPKHQNIANVVIKTAALTLKQLHCHESQARATTVRISYVKFCLDKGF